MLLRALALVLQYIGQSQMKVGFLLFVIEMGRFMRIAVVSF